MDDPRAAVDASPRMREIARLAVTVTLEPWSLGRADHERAHAAGLTDDDILHTVALSAYFGHLNRIADAVGVPLDYEVTLRPPPADPTVPAFAPAPHATTRAPAIELATRAATATAIDAWTSYVFDRETPLARADRLAIAQWVAGWLGDRTTTVTGGDPALRALARTVTLAPWQLTDASFATLRAAGFDDARLFDACVVASTAGVVSRIAVALGALAA